MRLVWPRRIYILRDRNLHRTLGYIVFCGVGWISRSRMCRRDKSMKLKIALWSCRAGSDSVDLILMIMTVSCHNTIINLFAFTNFSFHLQTGTMSTLPASERTLCWYFSGRGVLRTLKLLMMVINFDRSFHSHAAFPPWLGVCHNTFTTEWNPWPHAVMCCIVLWWLSSAICYVPWISNSLHREKWRQGSKDGVWLLSVGQGNKQNTRNPLT